MNNVSMRTPQVATQLTAAQTLAQQDAPVSVNEAGSSFMQLLSAVLGTGAEAVLADQLKKDAELLGAQISADMMAINPLLMMMLSGQAGSDAHQQAVALDLLSQSPSPALAADAALSAELLAQLQDVTGAVLTPPAVGGNNLERFATALDALTSDGGVSAELMATAQAGSGSGGTLALQGQSQFKRAVNQAHQLIKEASPTDSGGDALDLEALQKKVDSGAFLQHLTGAVRTDTPVAASETSSTPSAQEIFSQLQTAVTRHAADGETDFTIKLRPEGLGEITVKLLEAGGKVTLSLAASDINVQRLLGSELNNLRDIMRPYNVEVSQVAQTNEAQGMNMQQQFSQQFSQHRFTGQQQNPAFAYDPDYGESARTDEPAQPAVLPDAMLDAYI